MWGGYVRYFGLSNYLDIKSVQFAGLIAGVKLNLFPADFQAHGDVISNKGFGG